MDIPNESDQSSLDDSQDNKLEEKISEETENQPDENRKGKEPNESIEKTLDLTENQFDENVENKKTSEDERNESFGSIENESTENIKNEEPTEADRHQLVLFSSKEDGLQYLLELNDPEKIVNDKDAYEIFPWIQDRSLVIAKGSESQKLHSLLGNVLVFLLENDIDFEGIDTPNRYRKCTSLMERKVFILDSILKIINHSMSKSLDLRIHYQKKRVIGSILKFIGDLNRNYHKYDYLKQFLVFNLNWMSKEAENYKEIWNNLNTIETLLKFNENTKIYDTYINMIIANVATDSEIESHILKVYSGCDNIIEMFLGCVHGSYIIVNMEVADSDDKQKAFDIRAYHDTLLNATVSLAGILVYLYKLSVNNTAKQRIYFYAGFKNAIQTLIYLDDTTDLEKHYALQLLAQLAFDSIIKDDLLSNTKLIEYTQQQQTREDFIFLKLKKSINQFLWILKSSDDKASTLEKSIKSEDKHVMISYNSESRNLCLKIKSELEKANHKVWIDVYEMNGSTYESMSEAIENAKCVLMCVTEKYRMSVPCQLEVKYSMKLNKIIIPCIMQKGYGNVRGWLGMIIMDLIFIDFSKYEFDIAIEKLLNQIKLRTEIKPPVSVNDDNVINDSCVSKIETPVMSNPSLNADLPIIKKLPRGKSSKRSARQEPCQVKSVTDQWSESDVENWFIKNDCTHFHDVLKPLNGKVLEQLNEMRIHTPEFFFRSLSDYDQVDIKSIAFFSSLLKELYD